MHRKSRTAWLISLLAAFTLVVAACGDDDGSAEAGNGGDSQTDGEDAGGESGELSGEILVSGSSTVEPISARVAELYAEEYPNVAITVNGPGTGDGFEIFCNGESDVSDASRPIKEEEIANCEENGIEFVELKVAIDGLSVITSTANDEVSCLSFGDLYALLGPESTGFGSWSDANDIAAELDGEYGTSQGPFADVPLAVTAPGEESGTFDSFVEIVLEGIADERGEEPAPRLDYQASPNDNVIVEGISGTDTSLGWVGYAFVQANPDAIQALEVDGGDGCVAPTPETIASGEFPIARDLFIYVSVPKLEEKPELEAFVDMYMSDEGFAQVTEAGYVDLADDAVEETRSVWESRETGTRES